MYRVFVSANDVIYLDFSRIPGNPSKSFIYANSKATDFTYMLILVCYGPNHTAYILY